MDILQFTYACYTFSYIDSSGGATEN